MIKRNHVTELNEKDMWSWNDVANLDREIVISNIYTTQKL